MKRSLKTSGIILFAALVVLSLGVAAYADASENEAVTVNVTPLFGGWENWPNSPNNPNPGQAPGVTQLLVGITDSDGNFISALEDKTLSYNLTFSWDENGTKKTKSVTMSPGTVASAYNLVRFETVLAEGDNRFIPSKNQAYTLSIEVTANGVTYRGTSADGAFTVPMFPVVDGEINESYVYVKSNAQYPYTLTVEQYHSGTEEKDGMTYYENDWEIWNGKKTLILMVGKENVFVPDDIAAGIPMKISFNGSQKYDLTIDSIYDFTDQTLLRIPTEGVFEPEDNRIYTVDLEIYSADGTTLKYTGRGENFTADGVAVVPQTGDMTLVFVLISLMSVMAAAFVLSPKKRRG